MSAMMASNSLVLDLLKPQTKRSLLVKYACSFPGGFDRRLILNGGSILKLSFFAVGVFDVFAAGLFSYGQLK